MTNFLFAQTCLRVFKFLIKTHKYPQCDNNRKHRNVDNRSSGAHYDCEMYDVVHYFRDSSADAIRRRHFG